MLGSHIGDEAVVLHGCSALAFVVVVLVTLNWTGPVVAVPTKRKGTRT